MYLKKLYMENSGPIKSLSLRLPFNDGGHPIPIVLMGLNGSGKTNLLSMVADALFEAATVHYSDVVSAGAIPIARPWFRLIGPATITSGATGGCTLTQLAEGSDVYIYSEKEGTLPVAPVQLRVDADLRSAVAWPDDGAQKSFAMTKDAAKAVFEAGVYVYFPSNRGPVYTARDIWHAAALRRRRIEDVNSLRSRHWYLRSR